MHASVEHRQQSVEDEWGDARSADRHAAGAREHHGADDVGGEGGADADGARSNSALLVRSKIGSGNRRAGVGSQRRGDAVDGDTGFGQPVDDLPRCCDVPARIFTQGDFR
jgi:hypothetical protein